MDGTDPRAPDAVAADAARLARAVERFGAVRLSRQPDLCRNVLGDLFPEDRLAAQLLTAAAAERVPERLAERGQHVDPRILVPQLAADLAEARGLRDDYALRAVHTWTAALGISLDAPPAPVQDEPVTTDGDPDPEPAEVLRPDPGSMVGAGGSGKVRRGVRARSRALP